MIIQKVNGTGIKLIGAPNEKIREIRAYTENGSVQFWVEPKDGTDLLAYLTPVEAMTLAKALDRLAVEALRDTAE